MKLPAQALLLCVLGAAAGLAGNALSPRPARLMEPVLASAEQPAAACGLPGGRMPEIPRISVEEAKPLCVACTAIFVDARSAREFAEGHISGALHLAPGERPDADLLERLRGGRTAVLYDRAADCALADEAAKALVAAGAKDVRVLTGAWPAWMAAGAPGEAGPCALCRAGDAR